MAATASLVYIHVHVVNFFTISCKKKTLSVPERRNCQYKNMFVDMPRYPPLYPLCLWPLLPAAVFLLLYLYLKHVLVSEAFLYQESARSRVECVRRVAKLLRRLSEEYEEMYFCYLPMSHGLDVPRMYPLFVAIQHVLDKANRPGRTKRACRTSPESTLPSFTFSHERHPDIRVSRTG